MSEPLRDYDAAAEWLGVPKKWLQGKVQAGEAPCTRLGKHVRFSQAHLDAIVAAGEKAPVTSPASDEPTVTRRPRPLGRARR